MNRGPRVIVATLATGVGVVAARRLLAMSNTQVHRINQDKPALTEKETRP